MSFQETPAVYNAIGLGFGPANLAIAAAMVEKNALSSEKSPRDFENVLFLERHSEFKWHPGMLLPNARMQISFLKDLATLRSPQSPVTFLAYLQSQDRLLPFINRGSFNPTRKEFADYLCWASQYVQDHGINVNFGEEVVGITQVLPGYIDVRSRRTDTGEEFVRRTKNLILSPGGTAKFPSALSIHTAHPNLIHSSTYATSIDGILASIEGSTAPGVTRRIAVVGAGQSAAEILLDLHDRFASGPETYEVDLVFRKGSMKPSDDSPFANEIFDPATTDVMFNLSQSARVHVMKEYHSTNYSVVNPRTLDSLYEMIYDQRLDQAMAKRGKPIASKVHVRLRPFSHVSTVEEVPRLTDGAPSQFRFILQNVLNNEISEQTYDAVVCGTGYERSSWSQLLAYSDVGKYFGIDASTASVQLVPSRDELSSVSEVDVKSTGFSSSSSVSYPTSTGDSTPLTSAAPSPSLSTSQLLSPLQTTKLQISRNYRLLPIPSAAEAFSPKIYLQGCTETSHGISESLLSILGVRAGLVVDDILRD
ncbi:L-lysine 6-monooxygenase (NADPH-requiring)-domain-containing protein [Abortiporus biennis]|nr:L-lysine 6-monooxygenase (NADPH-requiring)-domain-containing protein [Abortiporus biennis]